MRSLLAELEIIKDILKLFGYDIDSILNKVNLIVLFIYGLLSVYVFFNFGCIDDLSLFNYKFSSVLSWNLALHLGQ